MILEATVRGRVIRVEVRGGGGRYRVTLDGVPLEVDWVRNGPHCASCLVGGESHEVGIDGRRGSYEVLVGSEPVTVEFAPAAQGAPLASRRAHGPTHLTAPMPGRVLRVLERPGAEVAAGQGLVVIEAMKMENELKSPCAGRVRKVAVREGQAVEAGALLAVVG
jgi:biotin carboxyl carrier protein